jgi:hypothetical protein
MPFQKGNQFGRKSKRKSTPVESKEEKVVEEKPASPIRKAITMYREPTGWVVDIFDIQDGKVIHTEHVCPSTLKGEAIESYKLTFYKHCIEET